MITEKKMFEDAQVGDRVWEFVEGWGTISGNDFSDKINTPIRVIFDNGYEWSYTYEGKTHFKDSNPILFWNEIKFEVPEKPFDLESELKKLEIKDFIVEEFNYNLYWCNKSKKIECNYGYWSENPLAIYFTENSVKKFMEKIEDEKITKEQFFDAYKKVFGGKIIC